MPKLEYTQSLDINMERFLNACTPLELADLERLLGQARYQKKIAAAYGDTIDTESEIIAEENEQALLKAKEFKKAIRKFLTNDPAKPTIQPSN